MSFRILLQDVLVIKILLDLYSVSVCLPYLPFANSLSFPVFQISIFWIRVCSNSCYKPGGFSFFQSIAYLFFLPATLSSARLLFTCSVILSDHLWSLTSEPVFTLIFLSGGRSCFLLIMSFIRITMPKSMAGFLSHHMMFAWALF